jgi:site-specific recombinase
MRWLSRKWAHGVAGIGGNISIGVLLGMVPVIGTFFGVPLQVRHVTLSAGSLALAAATLGHHAFERGVGLKSACLGMVVIFTLNLGVSFAFALAVALRARAIEHGGVRVLKAVLKHFAKHPGEFFFPPKNASSAAHH